MSNSNPGLYFKWVPNVNAALTVMNLASNGSMQTSFRQHYNDSAKTALEFCSHDLKGLDQSRYFLKLIGKACMKKRQLYNRIF